MGEYHFKTLLGLIKKPERGTCLKMTSHDFSEFSKKGKFFKFTEECLKNKVEFIVYGKKIAKTVRREIKELKKAGIKTKIVKKPIKEHYLTVDSPRQMWLEQRRDDFYAHDAIWIDYPNESLWKKVNDYFKVLDRQCAEKVLR